MALCHMGIVAQAETILQLQDNWYLVHTLRQFTVPFTCRNASDLEIFLMPDANHFSVSLSCQLQLRDHLIISDLSLKLDTSIKPYEWELEKITLYKDEEACFAHWLTILGNENAGQATLASIGQYLAAECHSPF
jgi:hypothetical protein